MSKVSPCTAPALRLVGKTITRESGCIEFTGSTNRKGYGQIMDCELGRVVGAHRVAWEAVHGSIPDGFFVLYRCDNPPCVNVDHLFLGTNRDNALDMVTKGRHPSQRKTRCPVGHPYDDANTYINAHGHRRCRACNIEACRRRRQKASA